MSRDIQTTKKWYHTITPVNVVTWCCVLVFIAACLYVMNEMRDGLPEEIEGKLYDMVLYGIASFAVASFGKTLGSKIDKKSDSKATAAS